MSNLFYIIFGVFAPVIFLIFVMDVGISCVYLIICFLWTYILGYTDGEAVTIGKVKRVADKYGVGVEKGDKSDKN